MRMRECMAPSASCTARGSLHLFFPLAACRALFRGTFCCSRFTCKERSASPLLTRPGAMLHADLWYQFAPRAVLC